MVGTELLGCPPWAIWEPGMLELGNQSLEERHLVLICFVRRRALFSKTGIELEFMKEFLFKYAGIKECVGIIKKYGRII